MASEDVGNPEVSFGGDILFELLYNDSVDVILGFTWRHDLRYKNKGKLTRQHSFKDPLNQVWHDGPGDFSRSETDSLYRTELKNAGFSLFANIVYFVNRLFGWFLWYDLNEWSGWKRLFS